MRIIGINCDPSTIRNFGKGDCQTLFGALQYIVLARLGSTLDADDIADLMATLLARNTADAYDERMYLLGEWKTVETAYQDATTTTWGNGSTSQMRAAVAAFRLLTDDGGTCMASALQSIDDLQDTFGVYFITNNDLFIGTQYFNPTTEAVECAPIRLSRLTAETPVVFTYENPDQYPLYVEIADKDQLFVKGMIIGANVETIVQNMPNIQDVFLDKLGALSGAGVVDVSLAAGCGAINLADDSLTTLFANVARWRIWNFQTGATITLTSVSQNAAKSGLTFDIDSADTDYPTSGQYLAIELVAVQTLAGAGLEYYESVAENFNGVNKYLLVKIP